MLSERVLIFKCSYFAYAINEISGLYRLTANGNTRIIKNFEGTHDWLHNAERDLAWLRMAPIHWMLALTETATFNAKIYWDVKHWDVGYCHSPRFYVAELITPKSRFTQHRWIVEFEYDSPLFNAFCWQQMYTHPLTNHVRWRLWLVGSPCSSFTLDERILATTCHSCSFWFSWSIAVLNDGSRSARSMT